MSYLNIGGGCDSCSTVGMDVPMNQMQGIDQNSNLVANMVNVPSINNSMNSVNGISNTSMNNIVNTQNMNSGVNNNMVQMNGGVATNNATNNNVAVNGAMNNAVMNNSNSSVNNAVVMPQMNSVSNNVVPNNNGQKKRAVVSPTNLVMLGLVIFAALASNESASYHLNQAVKFNEANPMYYVLYAVVAILLCLAAYHYMTNN